MTQLARLSDFEERAEAAVRDVNLGIERFASVLKEIKDLGLYKGEHETFEDYCRARWGRSLRTVQRALKAHDTRQKLLAAAPEPEKEAIQKASTAAILEKSKDMDHLVIGRKQPTATKTADFYSSEPGSLGAIAEKYKDAPFGPLNLEPDDLETVKGFADQLIAEQDRRGCVRILRSWPSSNAESASYLLRIADCVEKGEPASHQGGAGQIAQRVLLAFIEKQPEEHRDYLRWVAQEIVK